MDLVKSLLNSVFLVVLTLSIQILAKHPWWATKQKEKIAANPWCELQRTETIVVKLRLALQRREKQALNPWCTLLGSGKNSKSFVCLPEKRNNSNYSVEGPLEKKNNSSESVVYP